MANRNHQFNLALGLEIPDDRLDRSCLAKEFCERVMRTNRQSCIAMIDGEWGSGKTVFLGLCDRQLSYNIHPSPTVIRFNAWQQSYAKNALLDLTDFIARVLPRSRGEELRRLAGNAALHIAVSVNDQIANRTMGLANFEGLLKGTKNRSKEVQEHLNRIQQALVAATEERRLVILIDEVDRCEPAYALNLIETAYLLFKVPGVFVIFAVNREALEQSIQVTHGAKYDAEWYLRRFLDEQLTLPNAAISHICDLLKDRLTSADWFMDLDEISRWDACRVLALIPFIPGRSIRDLEVAERLLHRIGSTIEGTSVSDRYSGGLNATDLANLVAALISLRMISSRGFEALVRNSRAGGAACVEVTKSLSSQFNDAYTDEETMYYLGRLYALLLAIGGTTETRSGPQVASKFVGSTFRDAGVQDITRTVKQLRLRHANSQTYDKKSHQHIALPIREWCRVISQELPHTSVRG